ncbi:MAG: isoleucine--tRNA ligase [Deltaproteobacteria bacterium]|nr:MAG: isoleucine--tRNA ligase [Deltaproteobacteria bacterium]
MKIKDTLNLPQSSIPMKANLSQREPQMLKQWEASRIYEEIIKKSKGYPKFILHDGPPYANGHIHMGTALNKVLKDFIIKSKFMAGYDSTYVPGWDCHGLPIEHQVEKELKAKNIPLVKTDLRKRCRSYAKKFIDIQRKEFKRLGVFGEWDDPYLTMNFSYEATIVREFGKFVKNGGVYLGEKPVYWCASCKTALADAEVEYGDHKSPSIYVKFPMKSKIEGLEGRPVYVLIWTTTPWTIPANLAIALHPEFEYVAVEVNGEAWILARELRDLVLTGMGIREYTDIKTFRGAELERLVCKHPFLDQDSILILADHVTLEAGTGCVHTAPGHGQEDYEVGLKYNLPAYAPLDDDGRFTKDVPFFAGQFVFDANEAVIRKLEEVGCLLKVEEMEHSYPHCWRCKSPIIFRSTRQWFISMETNDLRKKTLDAINHVTWIPTWGRERIYNMVENRPDWCISRQRSWGVPIIALHCNECGRVLLDGALVDRVAELVEKDGADVWFEKELNEIFDSVPTCPHCGSSNFRKETDILDVWFDSGVSHAAVLEQRPELAWPADLYLEGSDQHRGWFHSSLLESVGTRDTAPYKSVLTHGFVVDGEGKKMSKSLGNIVAPEEVIKKYGAEIIRLWVAAEDYRNDIKISQDILKQLTDGYRRIRNTFRFMLGNLYDFTFDEKALNLDEMEEIDRYILHRLAYISRRVLKAYETYDFHIIYHTVHTFCAVDLSAFYLDVLKDRLYVSHPDSRERRSSQTALYHLINVLARLLAPILTFTMEEVWQTFRPITPFKEESVHLTAFETIPASFEDKELADRWEHLLEIRQEVSKVLEEARKNKEIGHSLDAQVVLSVNEKTYDFLKNYEDELDDIFIVSKVILEKSTDAPLNVEVSPAQGEKCERCWHYKTDVGQDKDFPTVCGRCAGVLRQLS